MTDQEEEPEVVYPPATCEVCGPTTAYWSRWHGPFCRKCDRPVNLDKDGA